LSVSLAVLMQIIGSNLDRMRESTAQSTAISLTRSLLDQLGTSIPIRIGNSSGDFDNGFHWRVRVDRYGSAADQRAWPVQAVIVTASTFWDRERKSLTLRTLRLIPKEER
jgi:hypothetical protein